MGLLNLDKADVPKMSIIDLSRTFQNGEVSSRYWMYCQDTRGNRRIDRGRGKAAIRNCGVGAALQRKTGSQLGYAKQSQNFTGQIVKIKHFKLILLTSLGQKLLRWFPLHCLCAGSGRSRSMFTKLSSSCFMRGFPQHMLTGSV